MLMPCRESSAYAHTRLAVEHLLGTLRPRITFVVGRRAGILPSPATRLPPCPVMLSAASAASEEKKCIGDPLAGLCAYLRTCLLTVDLLTYVLRSSYLANQ